MAYHNLGLLCDSLNRYDTAISAFRLYVAASPNDKEVPTVKKKIAELEIKRTRFSPEGLAGKWTYQWRNTPSTGFKLLTK